MPAKIHMVLSNNNSSYYQPKSQINTANLASVPGSYVVANKTAPTALNAPILARVHNVRPGCGSCGRH